MFVQKKIQFSAQETSSYIWVSLSGFLAFSRSLSWEMSWYDFLVSFSSTTEFPISASVECSSWRDRCSTMPAPIESPKTFVVVRSRSLKTNRFRNYCWNYAFLDQNAPENLIKVISLSIVMFTHLDHCHLSHCCVLRASCSLCLRKTVPPSCVVFFLTHLS